MDRRQFLSAGTAGAFTIVGAQAVRGSQANSKVSVGLVGVGGRGTYDANIVNSDPRARINLGVYFYAAERRGDPRDTTDRTPLPDA